jgi:hypothetical protein
MSNFAASLSSNLALAHPRRLPFTSGDLREAKIELGARPPSDVPDGFRSIVNQKNSYGCEQESQDLI